MSEKHTYQRIILAGAIYDLVVTAALALPPAVRFILGLIAALDSELGFNTVFLPVDQTTVFFVNLAGCAVAAWAVAKIKMPTRTVGKIDAVFRFALVACQVWAVRQGATPILLAISAILLVIGCLEMFSTRQPDEDEGFAKRDAELESPR